MFDYHVWVRLIGISFYPFPFIPLVLEPVNAESLNVVTVFKHIGLISAGTFIIQFLFNAELVYGFHASGVRPQLVIVLSHVPHPRLTLIRMDHVIFGAG